jgi:hypothetical protein
MLHNAGLGVVMGTRYVDTDVEFGATGFSNAHRLAQAAAAFQVLPHISYLALLVSYTFTVQFLNSR